MTDYCKEGNDGSSPSTTKATVTTISTATTVFIDQGCGSIWHPVTTPEAPDSWYVLLSFSNQSDFFVSSNSSLLNCRFFLHMPNYRQLKWSK